jgi:hypothetical protein
MHYLIRVLIPALVALLASPVLAMPSRTLDRPPGLAGTLSGLPMGRERGPAEVAAVPIELPLKKTEVLLNVSGGLIEGEVAQVFTNNTDTALEAIYVFPLPSEATVTSMELRVGERVIRSIVKEREEARQEYETARTDVNKLC